MSENTQLGKYTLKRKIATGGMAEIWLSEQRGPGGFSKQLVIKRILPHLANDAKFVEMFLDEARLAAQLHHPNIVQIFDLGEAAGSYYIAMEYIQGYDLDQILSMSTKAGGPLDPYITARIISDACGGLDYAHNFADAAGNRLNLVHRDISPQNVLVSNAGQVKLVDFGVAKAASSSHKTQTGAVKGKFSYMSPEQIGGKVLDGRSDLFGMGIVLWELLCGERPFGHENELMAVTAILHGETPSPRESNPNVPQELARICLKALEKSADDRYTTADSMQVDLDRFLERSGKLVRTKEVSHHIRLLASGERPAPLPHSGAPQSTVAESGSATVASAGEPPPPLPPGQPTGRPDKKVLVDTVHKGHTKRMDNAPHLQTERVELDDSTKRGVSGGLIIALLLVLGLLGGGGFFLFTVVIDKGFGTGDGSGVATADTGAGGADAATVVAPDAGGALASADVGAEPGDVGASGPDTALAALAADLGGQNPPVDDAGVGVSPIGADVAAANDVTQIAIADTTTNPLQDAVASIDAGTQEADSGNTVAVELDVEQTQVDVGATAQVDAGSSPVDAGLVAQADTGAAPQIDLGAAPQIDLGAAPQIDLGAAPQIDLGATPQFDMGASPQFDMGASPQFDTGTTVVVAEVDSGSTESGPDLGTLAVADTGGSESDTGTAPAQDTETASVEIDTATAATEEDHHHSSRDDDEPGTLRLTVSPRRGRYDVYIDGELVGRTPLAPRELPPGRYRVEVRELGADEGVRERVRIRPGRTSRVSIDMNPE